MARFGPQSHRKKKIQVIGINLINTDGFNWTVNGFQTLQESYMDLSFSVPATYS